MSRKIIVGDLESDGLVDTATRIWCGSFRVYGTKKILSITPENTELPGVGIAWYLYNEMMRGAYFVCHNNIQFDAKLILKLTGTILPPDGLIDTLILSKMFFPDIKGYSKPHSLDAWGQRFGIEKPEHDDWTQYSPEMLHRNVEDMKINEKLLEHLMKHGLKL